MLVRFSIYRVCLPQMTESEKPPLRSLSESCSSGDSCRESPRLFLQCNPTDSGIIALPY